MPDPEKMISKDLAEALRDELPAGYHDDCTLETIERLIDNPAEELARLNEHRKSNLTSDELVFILNEAKKMLEKSLMSDKSPKPPKPWPKAGEPPALKGIPKTEPIDLEIAPCPYCPDGGTVQMACTDLENEKEFQVWCCECWAHGPSMATEMWATLAWNAVSKAARGEELKTDARYILIQAHPDGNKKGQFVVFRWRTEDGKYNVFNPEGEADMQSAFKIDVHETEQFIAEVKESR